MRRLYIILISLVAIAACATTNAGSPNAGSQKSVTLKADRITSFVTTLPVSVVITDSSSPCAFIEIPSDETARWIICRVEGSSLTIYPRDDKYRHKLNALSADNPIKVRIESSAIGEITSTSSAEIVCRNKRFAESLSINNTGTMRITADDITLEHSFDVSNTGRFALDVKQIKAGGVGFTNTGRFEGSTERFECRTWMESNTGVIDLSSHIAAEEVMCMSTGRDNLSLEVNCKNLEISSTGAGSLNFAGTADNVSVSSTGSAHISTANINRPKH